ncbi:MAG: glutathione S-transferase family protein [Candidatus Binataceae bacterium]
MKFFTFATSPYARKVRMILDYKGVGYEPVERCYSLDRKADLKAASKRAEVPVIVLDDGRIIADSTIICEYIEQVNPDPPVYPRDPYERARARFLEDLCDRAFDAIAFGYFLAVVRKDAPEAPAMQAAAKDEFRALLEVLERELGGHDYLCGGAVSVADFAAICHVPMARAVGIELAQLPALAAWTARMRKLPMVSADIHRAAEAMAAGNIAEEFEGPDGRVHWRDSRLEWPVRHGFIDLVAREFHSGKMMFPPDAS